jgi:hypothetical protein
LADEADGFAGAALDDGAGATGVLAEELDGAAEEAA